MPGIFSFVALKYRNLLPGLAPEGSEDPDKGLLLPCLERIGERALAG